MPSGLFLFVRIIWSWALLLQAASPDSQTEIAVPAPPVTSPTPGVALNISEKIF